MRALVAITLLVASHSAVLAQPRGCDDPGWNLGAERLLLADPAPTARASGTTLAEPPPTAVRLMLESFASNPLVRAPERAPKDPASFAGHLELRVAQAGSYRVTLSGEGWIDVIQSGAFLKAEAFSGRVSCPGIRKSVLFRLAAEPVILQVSGSEARTVAVAITRVE